MGYPGWPFVSRVLDPRPTGEPKNAEEQRAQGGWLDPQAYSRPSGLMRAVACDPVYRRRHFFAEPIDLCVRWDITYRLCYGGLVAIVVRPIRSDH
jgi:hypothetical protein